MSDKNYTLKNVNKLENSVVELEISINAEAFENACDEAYKKNVKKIQVQGYRKGHAPKKLIEKLYGEAVFYDDAVNALYPAACENAIRDEKLDVVSKADIEVTEIGKDGFTFKAKVTVKPEVELGNYKGIKATKKLYDVTDEEVNKEIDAVLNRNSRMVSVERKIKKDDIAVIDFEGFVDGVAFDGGKGENFNLTIGSGQFIPGFEDQLIGHSAGEDVDVNVKFPAEYHVEELKNSDALFKVKIHEVKAKELPVFDDEFVKDVSEFDTVEDYKKSIKQNIQNYKDKNAENDTENEIIDEIVNTMKVDVPEVMIQNQIDMFIQDYEYKLQQQGMDFKTYLQYTGSSEEEFRKMFREQAEKRVKIRLALEKIVEVENIVISDEDIDNEFEQLSKNYNMKPEELKKFVPIEEVSKDIAVGKAIEFVKNSAVIKEEKAEDVKKETPAKKAAAKKSTAKSADDKSTDKKKTTTKKTTSKTAAAKKSTAKKDTKEEK